MGVKKGKFIVIDGTDGSGKATQTKLLIKRLKKEGYKVKAIDFPRYCDNFFGKMIGECLVEKYGNFLAIDPHIASVLYAADRWESNEQIKKWLMDGNIVIADRYASSNQIHQGAKISNKKKRIEFLKWLEKLEYETFKIPRPDNIIFLDVPINITLQLLKNKTASERKKYMEGKGDSVENNPKHLYDSQKRAIELLKKYNNWIKIDCVKNRKLMSIKEINNLIWNKIMKII
jgi:dTMP kinase